MKTLILDDSEYKIKSLTDALEEWGLDSDICVARSFQRGLRAIKEQRPNLVLLDMTIPTSERDDGVLTGRIRIFGGREILEEIEFEQLSVKIIVVTQFDRFGEPPKSFSLEELFDELHADFPKTFLGGVYYSNIDTRWRDELKSLLKQSSIVK